MHSNEREEYRPRTLVDRKRKCRGIVMADVLAQGLSRRAIATRKLKGVNRDKGHERFILVRPLTTKVKAYV